MSNKLLLTISDLSLASLCRAVLTEHGFEVEIARGRAECFLALRSALPAALILEYELAWGGAGDILSQLRSESQWQSVPVILIAPGYLDEKVLKPLQRSPIVTTLSRPFDPEKLVRVLRPMGEAESLG